MKRFLSFLLLPLASLLSCRAQTPRQPAETKSLLWKISGKGLSQPSYLFGTIHLICPGDYLWTDAMQRSLAACKQVCLELDMDDPKTLSSASEGLMNTGEKKLKDYFTPAQYARLEQFAKDTLHTSLAPLQMLKPIALESVMLSKIAGCMIPVSYEANIMEKAHQAKQEVIGLEEVKEQVDAIASLPDDTTVSMVMKMTDSLSASQRDYAKMVQAYVKQDLPELYRQIAESGELGDDGTGALLTDRNARWIPRIERIVKGKPTFFAVGAGHLWGDAGVITLLRRAGYTVEAVK